MKLESNSLIDPILLFLLSQIAVVLPILIPFQRTAAAAAETPAVEETIPEAPPAIDLEALAAEHSRLAAEAARLRAEAGGFSDAARAAAAQRDQADRQAAEEQARQNALRAQSTDMDRRQAQSASQARQSAETARQKEEEARRLAQSLAERKSHLGALEQELAQLKKPSGRGPLVDTNSSKEKVWLQLFNRRVLPVEEPYYSVKNGYLPGGEPATQFDRQHAGESVADLDKPGSLMRQWLRGQNAKQKYIACLVQRDSFGAYLQLREWLLTQGFEVGWEPLPQDRDRLVFTGRAGCRQGGGCPQ